MHRFERVKRPRALQACEVCRTRKNRCSEDRPCTYCVEHDLECTYSRSSNDKRQKTKATQSSSFDHRVDEQGDHQLCFVASRPHDEQIGIEPIMTNANENNDNGHAVSTITPQSSASDVMDTNQHTSNLEFYGSASSVAFLRHVETLSNCQTLGPPTEPAERSLASRLHNNEFQPESTSCSVVIAPQQVEHLNSDRYYFRVARRFLDAYFANIHHIQPLFEEDSFLARCEDLWFDQSHKQTLSFVALYHATLSLGALVMTFETTEVLGASRFTWSRKLFNDSIAIVARLGQATSLEMVQIYHMLGKICQHELNPHVAYLYSGLAARVALAIGLNRAPVSAEGSELQIATEASKTWWAVYCLDIQTSFALGRPDSLGPDAYHTQYLPFTVSEGTQSVPHVLQIVPCMVGLSQIMRKVALELYTQPLDTDQKLLRAQALDADLKNWLDQTPSHLRSELHDSSCDANLKPRRLPSYIKKQSVVLRLRYLNLRMVIHAVFMSDTKDPEANESAALREGRCRCIQAADDTIDLIYAVFSADDYFQTWWYNATYTLYAVSVLLALVFRRLTRTQAALENLFSHIDRAIVVLQAMDDCPVARNATAIIKRTLVRAKKVDQPALNTASSSSHQNLDLNDGTLQSLNSGEQFRTDSENVDAMLQCHIPIPDNLVDNAVDLGWLNSYPFDDNQQALFWTDWAHELDTLGK